MRKAFILLLALSLSPALARGDDDPEPPGKGGPELRELRGKWIITRRVFRGKDVPSNVVQTYEFVGDKLTMDGGKFKYAATVKVNAKNKPMVLELTREDVKTTSKMAFKIDKGELYLVLTPPKGDVQADEDFSGMNRPMMVLSREKKKE